MVSKKQFFKKRKANILTKDVVRTDTPNDFAEQVYSLPEDKILIVAANMIPRKYYPKDKGGFPIYEARSQASRKFLKHGAEVKPRRQYTLEDMLRDKKIPLKQREEAFNRIRGQYYCGYSFQPLRADKRKRKIPLVECLEGARLYYYANNTSASIDTKGYGSLEKAKRAEIEGSDFIVDVPSRTPKQPRYHFKLMSVPTIDSSYKYLVANDVGSDHNCESSRYKIRFNYRGDKEDSRLVNLCAHEFAAYLQIADNAWNKDKNIVPLQMNWFALPSQNTVDYYNTVNNRVFIEYKDEKGKIKYAPLNQGEKEIALWSLVNKEGYDKTFFAKGKIADYEF